jgi:pyruvate,water dikinase
VSTAEKTAARGLGDRLKAAFSALVGAKKAPAPEPSGGAARFRILYERFREILALNDAMLQLIADVEDKLSGRVPFALDPLLQRVRRANLDVFVMVKNLVQIAGGKYAKLYDALGRLNTEIENECMVRRELPKGPPILPLGDLRRDDATLAGVKMATLGEMKEDLGFRVPEGFAITTAAFTKTLDYNDLRDKSARLEGVLETYGAQALENACREVRTRILESPPPPDVVEAIEKSFDALAEGREIRVAMRSSAVGEDGAASHAGQYYSELNVTRDLLVDSYLQVVASCFKPEAVAYRYDHGLTDYEAAMAVGCMRMVDPRAAGIVFSRDFRDPAADRVIVSAVAGLAENVASGRQNAEEIVVDPSDVASARSSFLSADDLTRLIAAARKLETAFGGPQDVEYAFDADGELFLLQSRPMVAAKDICVWMPPVDGGSPPILEGGLTACPGAGAGRVFPVRGPADLERFPDGAVLVARHSSPSFSRVMNRCAAILTDVGSPNGHMGILSREYGVPTIVGLAGAMAALESGRVVTVDATARRVYDGALALQTGERIVRTPLANSPAVKDLRRIARMITPLHLTDPASPEFTPQGCRSLHDVTRFVHEKVYEVMFRFGDMASKDRAHSYKLAADLPIEIQVFDVGGGVRDGAGAGGLLHAEDVTSPPLTAFLGGMLDTRIVWNKPRPVSARGFLSVLGESMAGPPAEVLKVGGASFVVLSDRYLNFSTKAGYHFSTVDSYAGRAVSKNYVHFRFSGGGAAEDRRARRVRFLQNVLTHLDFQVQTRGDLLVARLEKYEQDFILQTLTQLGRLTMCARQLDMLMESDAAADHYAGAFVRGEMEKF